MTPWTYVNADHEPNTATQRHEGRMHNQSWKLRLYPSSAQKRSLAQWFATRPMGLEHWIEHALEGLVETP